MILKGAQRGNAKKLAVHLLNLKDNDVVEVHEVSGFLADDVTGAFKEVQAIAKGTRCTQPFFSVSLNPPSDVSVTIEMFEAAADAIAEINGLTGQLRVIVFHEKEGRRHAHVVWSRIDAATMTAKNLPHFKNRLQTISRDLFIQHGWTMPQGLRDRSLSSPTNVTLAEWQAAKRRGKNAIDRKALIQQCWAASDCKASFEAALSEHGYILAKGDRRSHVVVCHDGQVFAVARSVGIRVKQVRARLGEADDLPSVDEAMAQHAANVQQQFARMAEEADQTLSQARAELDHQYSETVARHQTERAELDERQSARRLEESAGRSARLKRGLSALWQSLTGKRQQSIRENEREAEAADKRDHAERQDLIDDQLKERRLISEERATLRRKAFGLIDERQDDRDRLIAKLTGVFDSQVSEEPDRNEPGQQDVHGDPRQRFVPRPETSMFTPRQVRARPELILHLLSHKEAQFTEADIKRALAKFIDDPIALRDLIDRALASSELVRLTQVGNGLLTTKDYQTSERSLDGVAARLAAKGGFQVRRAHVDAAIRRQNAQMRRRFGGWLSHEQRNAIVSILGERQLNCVVGLAGSATLFKTKYPPHQRLVELDPKFKCGNCQNKISNGWKIVRRMTLAAPEQAKSDDIVPIRKQV